MALIPVCDNCGEREGVEVYTISTGGRKVALDLCETHAAPAVALMDLLPGEEKPTKPVKRATRRPRVSKVTSMAEIEALKK